MGCTTSQPIDDEISIFPDVQQHLAMTPLGYHLSTDEIKQLCVDSRLVSCGPNNTLYDRVTAYQAQDKSVVVCMYYFGILCNGVAEVQSFDQSFKRNNYTIGPGSILLGEHLFDPGKRHSLNRGYNIIAKTQCTIFLVNLKTFEKYSKSLSVSKTEWWTNLCTDPAGQALATVFPNLPSHVRNELMTRLNWRVLDPGQRLTITPPFDAHQVSLKLPKSHTQLPTGINYTQQHANSPRNRPQQQGTNTNGTPITQKPDTDTTPTTNNQPDSSIPFQNQPQRDPLGQRSMFIVVKGLLRKYPLYLPPDPTTITHKDAIMGSTQQGKINTAVNQSDKPITTNPFQIDSNYEEIDFNSTSEDHIALHRRLRPRLIQYCKTHSLTQLQNGFVHPNEPVFEATMYDQSQWLLLPFVIAHEKTLVIEIPHHVYKQFLSTSYFQPAVQAINTILKTSFAQLVMEANIDFFKASDQTTDEQQNNPQSPTSPTSPTQQQYRTLNLRGQNALQLAAQYQQQQLEFFLNVVEMSEIFILKAGTIIQEPNRSVIDRLTIVLNGSLLIQDPDAMKHYDQQRQIKDEQQQQSQSQEITTITHGFNILARAGDYFNELGLVTTYSRPYGIRALTDVIYLTLSRSNFERLISNKDVSLFCIRLGRSQAPLEAILSHPLTQEAFSKLAQSEHSTENLDFYKRILEFRSKFEGVTRTEVKVIRDASGRSVAALSYPYLYTELLDIYNQFIRPDHALSQVNLPHHVVDQVRECLFDDDTHGVGPDGLIEGLTHRALDSALAEVILLMRRDIFTRFVVHESYLEILKQLKPYRCAWKDDKDTTATNTTTQNNTSNTNTNTNKNWAARLQQIRLDAPVDFPSNLTTTIEQQDLTRYEKFLEEIGLGIGNSYNLPQPNIE